MIEGAPSRFYSLRALDALLEEVDPQSDDVVVTLGDYVDRGPHSKGVLDRLLALRNCCRCVSLQGNLELMMLAAREDEEHVSEWRTGNLQFRTR